MSAGVATYLFETTNLTMWAEELAHERGIPAEVNAAPPEAEDSCGLALRVPDDRGPEMEAAMREEGIDFFTLEDALAASDKDPAR